MLAVVVKETEHAGNRRVLRFVLLFGALALASEVFLALGLQSGLFSDYLAAHAFLASRLLSLGGYESSCHQAILHVEGMAVRIGRGCDGLQISTLFISAVVAFPHAVRSKVFAIALGIPLLLALNMVRILSLALVLLYRPTFFEPLHVSLWPTLLILIASGLWFVWARSPAFLRTQP